MINYEGLFSVLIDMPNSCIFALRSVEHKKVYITHSRDIKKLLGVILDEIKCNIFRHRELCSIKDSLDIVILDSCGDDLHRKLRVKSWVDKFEEEGYEVYKDRTPLEHRVRTRIDANYTRVYVELMNKRRDITMVGVFENMLAAEDFILSCYSSESNPYCFPVYSINELTSQYRLDEEKEIQIRL